MPQRNDPPRRGRRGRHSGASTGGVLLLVAAWAAALAWGARAGQIPLWVLGAAVSVNVLTVLIYALDKSAAQGGAQRRTPESHLHLLGLVGGWPGAWFAQQLLRHKTAKVPFRRMYWVTVALNCLALLVWAFGGLG